MYVNHLPQVHLQAAKKGLVKTSYFTYNMRLYINCAECRNNSIVIYNLADIELNKPFERFSKAIAKFVGERYIIIANIYMH
jgi:hypothetical protein